MARAERMRADDEGLQQTIDADETVLEPFDPQEEPAMELGSEEPLGTTRGDYPPAESPSDAPQALGPDVGVEELDEPDHRTGPSLEPESLETAEISDSDYGDSFDDTFDDFPDLTLPDSGGHDEFSEAATSEHVLPGPDEAVDPFHEWQSEAENAAAAVMAKESGEDDKPEGPSPDRFLFSEDEFSTRPVEAHIASQKKIDNYLALFDITKELAAAESVAALWETILYGVMGQVGAETICIFSAIRERNGRKLFPVSHSGFELSERWLLQPGDVIYDECHTGDGVRYAEEFLQPGAGPISELEQSIISGTEARLIVPLKNQGQMYGVIFLGPQLSGDDYTVDDMEFLTLLGETAAVGVDRAMARREYEKSTELLRKKTEQQSRIFDVAREVSGVKNLDELYDLTAQHMRKDFGVESFSVVLLNPRVQEYRLFGGNQISPASIARFRLPVDSELVGTVSNLIRVYELPEFRENREVAACYTNDDLALMDHYWVIPLISLNWLVGYISIHKTSRPWEELDRELVVAAAEMLGPVYANAVILGERETLFRDPFSPLEGRLKLEVKKAREFQSSVSLVELRVKNIKRLMAANTAEQVAEFLGELGSAVAGFLFESDFLARVGQGRFALVLPGRTGAEAEIFVKKLKADFKRRRFLPGSPVDIQYGTSTITFPADAEDAGKMLAMLD